VHDDPGTTTFKGKFLVVYFDDILIYNKMLKQHIDYLNQVCRTLRKEKLYANPKKCAFMTDQVIFLIFVVSSQGVSANPRKVQAIVKWPEPQSIHDVRNFHGLATFNKRLIKGFSTIMASITDCQKKEFLWPVNAAKAFREINQKMTEAHVMRLSNFSKVFEVACDASSIGIGGLLSQKKYLIAYFSEKLSGTKQNY